MTTAHNPEKGPRNLSCEAWEAMLADALDGTLDARDTAAFEAHSRSCGAGCAELLEEAKRGTEWLRFLHQTPEAPQGLLEKILAGTMGLDAQPLAVAGAPAMPHQPWLGASIGVLQRHVMESRILMTLAMAFFSIALTLNLTGVHLNQLRLSDLRPSALATTLSHEYYTTWGHLNRYYSNLRIVYELESRVNEMRQSTSAPASRPVQQQPQQPQPQKQQPQSQPSNGGKPGGSAQKNGSTAAPEQRQQDASPAPVLAKFEGHAGMASHQHLQLRLWAHGNTFSSGPEVLITPRPGNQYKAFFLLTRAAEIHSAWPFLTERPHERSLDGQHLQETCLTPSERSLA